MDTRKTSRNENDRSKIAPHKKKFGVGSFLGKDTKLATQGDTPNRSTPTKKHERKKT